MLTNTVYNQIDGAFITVIDLLGVQAVWTNTKTQTTKKITVGFSKMSNTDQPNVNAYALAGKTLTAKARDFSSVVPEKFDSFVINDEKYIAETVTPVRLNDTVIGFKITTRGK
jgi:hypothetical protein